MFYYTNLYVFLLLSMSMTNVINYFLESSSIVYIAWFGVAMYTLFKFFQYSGDGDDDDEKEKKKKMLFKFFCFTTIAALTIATVMSWTNSSEVISSNIDLNQSKDSNIEITYDLSQYITEDMKVDKTNWDPEFDVNNIDYEHLNKYTLDELRQVIDAFDNDSIPYNKDLCNMVCDYVINNS